MTRSTKNIIDLIKIAAYWELHYTNPNKAIVVAALHFSNSKLCNVMCKLRLLALEWKGTVVNVNLLSLDYTLLIH